MYADFRWIIDVLSLFILSIPALVALGLLIGFTLDAKAKGIGVSKGWLVIGSVIVLICSFPAVRYLILNVVQ